jgi:putative ubiquitin-RnfH superfamily antitoxin RatB of RatAB toxin-antitoxin module
MRVHVAYVAPDRELLVALDLAEGSTVADAVRASRLAEQVGIDVTAAICAIHGRRVTADTLVFDGDRVDVTRPLLCDPKTVRRKRAVANPAKPR